MTPEQARARMRMRARLRAQSQQSEGGGIGSNIGAAVGQSARPISRRDRFAMNTAREVRSALRRSMPFAAGFVGQPLANTVADPTRRRELANSARGAVRDLQSLPSIDWERVGRETGANVERSVRGALANPLQTAGNVARALPGVLAEATGAPAIYREEQAQREVETARAMGADPTAAAQRANANTGQIALTAAVPPALGRAPSVLRAAGVGAGFTAPMALARDADQPLQERLPRALPEIGLSAALSAGLQGLANGVGRSASRREAAMGNIRRRAGEFEQAGVRPFLAAVRGASRGSGATDSIAAPLTMMTAENIVGGNARRNLANAAGDVEAAAGRLSNRFGEPASDLAAGEAVQSGIRRYSRGTGEPAPAGGQNDPWQVPTNEWSFADKANALYDPTFEALEYDARQMIGNVEGEVLTLANTQRTMDEIIGSISGTRSRARLTNERLQTMVEEMAADLRDGTLSFADMRRWRTAIREMRGDDQLRQGISRAELQRIEGALSQDIYQSADNIGGQAAQDLRKIDAWYARESQAIQNQLDHYYGADGGEVTFRRILQDARKGGNLRRIEALRERLRPGEWRTLAASIINDLGRPPKGRAHLGDFDLDAFVTNYQGISPAAREALFGGMEGLGDDLANLQRVAGYMKEVRGFTNFSRSGQATQNFGSMAAFSTAAASAFHGTLWPAMAVTLGVILVRATGEVLTNPQLVRWIVQAPKAGRQAATARAHLRRLAEIAARDPAVGALLATELSQPSGGVSRSQPSPAPQPAQQPLQ